MKLKLFGCPALRRELFLLASFSPHEIDVEILPAPSGAALLQDRIEETQGYDYILPCVGSRLSEGLSAAGIPLVIPRAHNCAHLLLGSLFPPPGWYMYHSVIHHISFLSHVIPRLSSAVSISAISSGVADTV